MILQSLAHLADREGLLENPDYETKEVHWVVNLMPDGRLISLETLLRPPEGKKKGRARGPEVKIPRPLPGAARTGIAPDAGFLVDNPSFAFGLDLAPEQKLAGRAGELERRFGGFYSLVEQAARAIDDSGLAAVHAFLSDPGQLEAARKLVIERYAAKELATNHLFILKVSGADGYIHESQAVMAHWAERRNAASGLAELKQCLITGELAPPVSKHPLIKKVPNGSPSGISIVSFNSSAFESFGFSRNDNAPVSRTAAEAYTTGLNRLLNRESPDPKDPSKLLPEQRVQLTADTVAVLWSDEHSAVPSAIVPAVADGEPDAARLLGITLTLGQGFDELDQKIEAEPDEQPSTEPLRATLDAPWSGITPSDLEDPSAFRLMVLSGAQGRATVRAFHTTTIRATVRAMQQWFRDIEMIGLVGKPALWRLLRALAVRGETKRLDPNLAGDLFVGILGERALPYSILEAAVRRCRSEADTTEIAGVRKSHQKVRPERAALIKAFLNRSRDRLTAGPGISFKEVQPTMNDDERNKGYLLGRMFACIERMQELALGDVNASVTDRYFSAACATPQAVFPKMLKLEIHHFRKAREGRNAGLARYLHKQIGKISSWLVGAENGMHPDERIEDFLKRNAGHTITGFPSFLPLPEQGLFTLGYHQQRAELFRPRAKKDDDPTRGEHSSESRANDPM